jgi:C-terminal peptidase prc
VQAVQNAADTVQPLQVLSGFVLAVVLGTGTVVATGNAVSSFLAEDGNGEVLERTLKFGTILENVKAAYVDRDVDLDAIFETGVNSMLSVLDPYSTYENTGQSEDLAVRTTGRYGGVGLTIGKDDNDAVLVLGALEGFAFDAGVRPGDRIVAVDGKNVNELSVDAVKSMLRGEPGTSIMLTVQRDGSPEPTLVMPVSRKLVRLPDVTLATLDRDGVGYIKLEGFSEGTAEETGRAIRRLQNSDRELKALVLDMRDNPGGLLDAAVAVSQQLVPEGTEIVSTSGRVYGEGTSLSYRSTKPPLLNPRTRLVVLVNANTASAAEIVTGVVQDTDRGVVIGQRTFGKGLVQIVEPLPGGGALKLTVAKYYTPSGRCIQAVSYAGGRVEASAKATGGAATLAPAAVESNEEPLEPGAPPLAPVAEPSKKDDSKGGKPSKGADPAGAIMRIDPSEPSRPQAASLDDGVVYVTAHGRAVKAGGGIAPDVVVEARQLGELERSLLQRGLFFQFAGECVLPPCLRSRTHAASPRREPATARDAARKMRSVGRRPRRRRPVAACGGAHVVASAGGCRSMRGPSTCSRSVSTPCRTTPTVSLWHSCAARQQRRAARSSQRR